MNTHLRVAPDDMVPAPVNRIEIKQVRRRGAVPAGFVQVNGLPRPATPASDGFPPPWPKARSSRG